MRRFAVLLVAAVLVAASGCSGPPESDEGGTTSPTVAPATSAEPARTSIATPSPTVSTMPALPTAPAIDLTDLPGTMAETIDAVLAGGDYLADLAPVEAPCVAPKPELRQPPRCSEGMTPGEPAPAIVFGTCPDGELQFLDPGTGQAVPADQMSHLTGVVRLRNGPAEYFAIYGYERASWLAFDESGGLIGAGGGGSCAAFGLRDRLLGADWVTGGIDWGFDDDLGPPLYEALARPVTEGPEALAGLVETVDSSCSFHGTLASACADQGLGLNDRFQGVIVSDLLFCEACALSPAELVELLRPVYTGGVALVGVWRLGLGGQQLVSERWPELTPTVALAFHTGGEPIDDVPIGFLLLVDPTRLHIDPSTRPIALVERISKTWTAADTARELGSWERIYPLP